MLLEIDGLSSPKGEAPIGENCKRPKLLVHLPYRFFFFFFKKKKKKFLKKNKKKKF